MPDTKERAAENRQPFESRFNKYQSTGQTYGKLRVNCPILSDSVWAENFLRVENDIENATISRLDIDLRACRWGDPIPLLCLLVLTTRLRATHVAVKISLGLPSSGTIEQIHAPSFEANPRLLNNGRRFLAFLANEGFIDAFVKAGVEVELRGNNQRVIVKNAQDVHEKITSQEIAYLDSTAITVDTICIQGEFNDDARREISDQVSARLNSPSFQARVQAQVENRFSEELISRLRVILIEGLINVAEHAYEKPDDPKVGAFYVRFRKGLIGSAQSERYRLGAFIKAESRESERLDVAFLTHQKGCLEVYVADNGVGLVKKLAIRHPELEDRPHKFRYYIENVLIRGISSNPDRRTAQGALSLIYRNASRYGDYLRIYSDQFWLGSSAPIPTGANATVSISKMVVRDREKTGPRGLYWQFRLGWNSSTDVDESWVSIAEHPQAMAAAQAVYSEPLSNAERSGFSNVLVLRGRDSFLKREDSESARHLDRHPATDTVVWFAGRHLLKNDILKRVGEIAEIDPERVFQRLYIVDIEPHDADFYLGALRGL